MNQQLFFFFKISSFKLKYYNKITVCVFALTSNDKLNPKVYSKCINQKSQTMLNETRFKVEFFVFIQV